MLSKCKGNRNRSVGSAGRLKRIWKPFSGTNELKKRIGFRTTHFYTVYIRFLVCALRLIKVWEKKTKLWHQEFLKELNINLKTWVWADQTTKRHFVTLILICSRWHLGWKCCWILHHAHAKYTIFHFLLIPFPKPPSIPSTPPNLAVKVSLA